MCWGFMQLGIGGFGTVQYQICQLDMSDIPLEIPNGMGFPWGADSGPHGIPIHGPNSMGPIQWPPFMAPMGTKSAPHGNPIPFGSHGISNGVPPIDAHGDSANGRLGSWDTGPTPHSLKFVPARPHSLYSFTIRNNSITPPQVLAPCVHIRPIRV